MWVWNDIHVSNDNTYFFGGVNYSFKSLKSAPKQTELPVTVSAM